METRVGKRENVILAQSTLEAPIKRTTRVAVARFRSAARWNTQQRAREAVEKQDKTSDEAYGDSETEVELVINVCSLEGMLVSAHQTGEINYVKKRHLLVVQSCAGEFFGSAIGLQINSYPFQRLSDYLIIGMS